VVRNVSRLTSADLPPTPTEDSLNGYILYQGVLNEGRGLEALLDAMPQVSARLVICGEGDLSAELRARAERLGLLASGQVEFRGFVLPTELRTITQQASLGVMLLENRGLSYYYSLANKFFDYLHAGIPQLVVDFPEYRRLNDLYDVAEVVALTPDSLAAAINRLLRADPARYQELAQNCRRARLELNWQREEQTLLALYASLTKPTPITA
jgi:glycosyltransferase involved in cell wall biosynthesis